MSLVNIDIAILTRLNELAERYGLKPTEFVATLQHDKEGDMVLAFEIPAQGSRAEEDRFDKMLAAVGVDLDECTLKGSDVAVYDALDGVLRRAPRPRQRR